MAFQDMMNLGKRLCFNSVRKQIFMPGLVGRSAKMDVVKSQIGPKCTVFIVNSFVYVEVKDVYIIGK